VAIAASAWHAPAWLKELGAWISISVLLVLGLANLMMVFRTPGDQAVPLVGIRSRWFAEQLLRTSHPLFIASIGAAFALSFDTISHALVFSLTGASLAGWLFATLLGLVFTLGMALAIAASAAAVLELSRPVMSLVTLAVVAAAYLIASRSIYGDGDSQYGTTRKQQAG
jgi:high-affinity nickel-transport protein